MGIVTRGKDVYRYDITQQMCRYVLCWCSVLSSEKRNRVRLAASYVAITLVQLCSTIRYRPYADSFMWSATIGLNVASICGCILGFVVVIVDDPSVEYPVDLLFGSWVLSFALFLVLYCGRCAEDAEEPHGFLQVVRHSTVYTDLLQLDNAAAHAEVP